MNENEAQFPFKDTTYLLNGIAMEVHRNLGRGLLEILYKDAFELELKLKGILYEREKTFEVQYKGITLPHQFKADFVIAKTVILEIKSQKGIIEEHYRQVLNYLAISKCKIGMIYNFYEKSLEIKRVII